MKIMITGANGSIGADLVNFFSKNNKIYAFYRTKNSIINNLKNKNIEWIQHDLKNQINKKIKPQIIIHSAITHPFSNKENYLGYINSNITSLTNTIEFAKKNNVKKFFYLSSVKLYGDFNENKLMETSPINNPDLLGVTKLLAEKILETQSFNYFNIRLPGTLSYLINNNNRPWLNLIINKIFDNQDVLINNPESKFNNIIDTIEIYKIISHIIKSDLKINNATFLLSAENPIQIKELIYKIKSFINSNSCIKFNKKKTVNFTINTNEVKKLYNFKTNSTLKIVKRYLDHLKQKSIL